MAQGNLGIEPEMLKAIYGQMARIVLWTRRFRLDSPLASSPLPTGR